MDRVKRTQMFAGLVMFVMLLVAGCGRTNSDKGSKKEEQKTEIQVFIAASLNQSMQEIAAQYEKDHPEVTVTLHADSSGTLLTQIEEGYECDLFFSAATKQMDQLERDGLVISGTRQDVLNNQVVLIKGIGEETKVSSLSSLDKAKSIALAAESVPVGKYTREALKSIGVLSKDLDASSITTKQVSDALGSVEISEQANVSKVLITVAEGACEVGTVYVSDTYGYEDKVEIIEKIPNSETGDVIYPACLVENPDATEAQKAAARDFYDYMLKDQAKEVFRQHYFDTEVNR